MRGNVRSTMRIIGLVTAFTLAAGLTLGLSVTPAAACSCIEPNDDQSFDFADAVFTGEVMEIREDADNLVFFVRVDEVFKGEVTEWQRLTSPLQSSECGIVLPTDTLVVVFGYRSLESDHYSVGLCDPNRAIDATDELFPGIVSYPPGAGGQPPDSFTPDDAPEPIEDDAPVPADEEVVDESASPLSEQDQAEMEAQAEFETTGGGATLLDGPAADDPVASGDDGSPLLLWLVGVLAIAVIVLTFALGRARPAT